MACASRLPDACLLCDSAAGPWPNVCADCAAGLTRLPWRSPSCFAAFAYQPPISTLVHWMKFEANLSAALTLGNLLADAVSAGLAAGVARPPDAILPMPLHLGRLRSRGFNQALELARPLARRLARPMLARACVRMRATLPQSGLASEAERRRNVAGAFQASRSLAAVGCIAIVDDVLTTGATVQELARTLRRAGASHVLIWTCAGRPAAAGVRRPG